jgi:hypothetical protein
MILPRTREATMPNAGDKGETVSATEARAGRIVKGGAILRVLVISTSVGIAALAIIYLFFVR